MRVKIIIPNLLILMILCGGIYFYLLHSFRTDTDQKAESNLKMMAGLFEKTKRLSGYDMLNAVVQRAQVDTVIGIFAPVVDPNITDAQIRSTLFKKAFVEVEAFSEYFKVEYDLKPEMVLVTEHTGVAIARSTTPNACPAGFNLAKVLPNVESALKGQPSRFIWSVSKSPFSPKKWDPNLCGMMGGQLLDVVVAPIWRENQIVGTLLVAFELSKGLAKVEQYALGMEIGYIEGSELYSTSMDNNIERKEVADLVRGSLANDINEALATRKPTKTLRFKTSQSEYMGLIAPLPGVSSDSKISYILFTSVDKAHEPLNALSTIFIFMGVALILLIVVGSVLTDHFMKPVEAIEEDLLRVINGDYKYRFEVKSAEVGGLCYRINQLIGALTGEEEEAEEESKGSGGGGEKPRSNGGEDSFGVDR